MEPPHVLLVPWRSDIPAQVLAVIDSRLSTSDEVEAAVISSWRLCTGTWGELADASLPVAAEVAS
jgi:hypothetical protein